MANASQSKAKKASKADTMKAQAAKTKPSASSTQPSKGV